MQKLEAEHGLFICIFDEMDLTSSLTCSIIESMQTKMDFCVARFVGLSTVGGYVETTSMTESNLKRRIEEACCVDGVTI